MCGIFNKICQKYLIFYHHNIPPYTTLSHKIGTSDSQTRSITAGRELSIYRKFLNSYLEHLNVIIIGSDTHKSYQ